MNNDVFWLKRTGIGRLHVCLGRNDAVYGPRSWTPARARASFHFTRLNGQVFITIRVRSRFLNVDWV